MKKIIIFIACNIFVLGLLAQTNKNILPTQSHELLNKYLVDIMHKQYAERKKRLNDALQSKEKLAAYQQDCKLQYKRLLTSFPKNIENAFPVADSIESIARDTYTIQKIILSKRITTNLYLPNQKGVKPAILFFCGHEMTSKATESYQKTAILLVKQGFIVLVIDPTGQGERVQLTDSTGKNLTRGSTTEHTLLNTGAGMIGWCVMNEELIDNFMCMNYLCSRSDVDKTKIGCIGNSGGGAQTSYYSAMDNRIKAAACCSWFTQRDRMLAINGPDDGCQYLWNEGRAQLEIADYYIMQAPRPTLILAGKKDFIDYKGSLNAFDELKQVFSKLGKPENAEYFAYDDGHGISKPKREVAARFFKKQLMNNDSPVTEGELAVLPDSVLRCTKSGQMRVEVKQEASMQERNLEMAKYYVKNRNNFQVFGVDSSRTIIKKILNLPDTKETIQIERVGKKTNDANYLGQSFIISRKDEPELPAQLLLPKNGLNPQAKVFILLSDSGMQQMLHTPTTDSLLVKGNAVILTDPRGIGETKDDPTKNNKKYYNDDYRNSALSLFIGRPLLGQRVVDILSVLDFISAQPELKELPISCITHGNIGVAAIHTAYLDNRLQKVDTNHCEKSWITLIEKPMEKNKLSLAIPKVLMYYDIPLLLK
jgi:dienelactone hydrolase